MKRYYTDTRASFYRLSTEDRYITPTVLLSSRKHQIESTEKQYLGRHIMISLLWWNFVFSFNIYMLEE